MRGGSHQPTPIPLHSTHVLRHCLCAHWWRYILPRLGLIGGVGKIPDMIVILEGFSLMISFGS